MIHASVDPRLREIAEGFNPDCMMHGEILKLKIALKALNAEGVNCHGLHDYVQNKERAMRNRLEGDIATALRYEARCDEIYDELPAWARW